MSGRKAPPRPAKLPPLPEPGPTTKSLALDADISRMFAELTKTVAETNLLRVRRLIELAIRGQAPAELVHHFSMIGRNYYELADNGPPKPGLRVIEGGAA